MNSSGYPADEENTPAFLSGVLGDMDLVGSTEIHQSVGEWSGWYDTISGKIGHLLDEQVGLIAVTIWTVMTNLLAEVLALYDEDIT
jgi:hypothetical protein